MKGRHNISSIKKRLLSFLFINYKNGFKNYGNAAKKYRQNIPEGTGAFLRLLLRKIYASKPTTRTRPVKVPIDMDTAWATFFLKPGETLKPVDYLI